jgi:hypothetical protein
MRKTGELNKPVKAGSLKKPAPALDLGRPGPSHFPHYARCILPPAPKGDDGPRSPMEKVR